MTRAALTAAQGNNFDVMRLLAAWLVLFSHSYHLTGAGVAEPLLQMTAGKITFGTLAVGVFFSISGYLITASAYARDSFLSFLTARARRIFPALVVAVLLSAFVLGPCMSALTPARYAAEPAVFTYVLRNITLFKLQYDLPGVFGSNPHGAAVNGSLWTLPVEFALYLAVGGAVFALRVLGWERRVVLASLALAAVCLVCWYAVLHGSKSGAALLVPYFMLGAAFRLWRRQLPLHGAAAAALVALLALAAVADWTLFPVLAGVAISYAALWLARHPRWVVPFPAGCIGDLSYGLYLFAFPVQQSIVALRPDMAPLTLCLLATLVALPLAWLTWHGVEQRFVRARAGGVVAPARAPGTRA